MYEFGLFYLAIYVRKGLYKSSMTEGWTAGMRTIDNNEKSVGADQDSTPSLCKPDVSFAMNCVTGI